MKLICVWWDCATKMSDGDTWTKADVVHNSPVNLSNQGQLCGVGDNVIVECIGIVDAGRSNGWALAV